MLNILLLPTIEVIIIGALAGLVGVLAVLHKRVFFAESITHATFPGAVLGVVVGAQLGLGHEGLSLALLVGAAAACVPMSWLMDRLAAVRGISSQSAAGIVLTSGFALGYFLNKWFAPLPLKIEGFLAGSVLNVSDTDVIVAAVVLAVAVFVVVRFGRHLVFYAFDGTGFRAAGLNAAVAEWSILGLITATLVVLIPAVGTILAIALVAAPAAALVPLLKSPTVLFVLAPVVGVVIGLVGLAIAVVGDFSAGGTIALVAGLFYVGTKVVHYAHSVASG